jgi:lipoprotein-anchoring transpeptidase ErfK/SrfK
MHQTRRHILAAALLCLLPLFGADAQTQRRDSSAAFIAAAGSTLRTFPVRLSRNSAASLHVQILLDLAHFSPGIIDAAWGANAARALAFFARPDGPERLKGGTPPTLSSIDAATYDRLRGAAGERPLLIRYELAPADVAGPFTPIPAVVYDQAKLKCLCYSSAAEAVAEKFHTSRALLGRLNPRLNLDRLTAGTVIVVPNVASENVASSMDTVLVAKLIISKSGFWTHAVDQSGTIVAHYPSTLGAGYDPSPTGKLRVTYVARDPAFRYQPKLFAEVPDDEPEARLPPGPNSPVGRVWMSLSKPHYGIHGTSTPETIGYAVSHGCVRLTNWDALQLADMIEPGTPVEFH